MYVCIYIYIYIYRFGLTSNYCSFFFSHLFSYSQESQRAGIRDLAFTPGIHTGSPLISIHMFHAHLFWVLFLLCVCVCDLFLFTPVLYV